MTTAEELAAALAEKGRELTQDMRELLQAKRLKELQDECRAFASGDGDNESLFRLQYALERYWVA